MMGVTAVPGAGCSSSARSTLGRAHTPAGGRVGGTGRCENPPVSPTDSSACCGRSSAGLSFQCRSSRSSGVTPRSWSTGSV